MERKPLVTSDNSAQFIKTNVQLSSNRNKNIALILSSIFFITANANAVFTETDEDCDMRPYEACDMCPEEACDTSPLVIEENKIAKVEDGVTKTAAISRESQYYLPYLQIGGERLFNVESSKAAISTNLFIPIWQEPSNIIFTDLRTYDITGKPFEGSVQLGYRHLSSDEQRLYGIYGSFDRKRTLFGNYFNQLTLGGECWINHWFIGGNIYKPIGKTTKDASYSVQDDGVWLTRNRTQEQAVPGVDAEIGYEITNRITGYVGGYYFSGKDIGTKYGPKARIAYDWSLDNGDRILGIFDKIGFEAGVQRDKVQGTVGYLSANVRIGWLLSKKPVLQGVSRHMVDIVRRDVNIVTVTNSTTEREPSPSLMKTKKLSSHGVKNDPPPGGGNINAASTKTDSDQTVVKNDPPSAGDTTSQESSSQTVVNNDIPAGDTTLPVIPSQTVNDGQLSSGEADMSSPSHDRNVRASNGAVRIFNNLVEAAWNLPARISRWLGI